MIEELGSEQSLLIYNPDLMDKRSGNFLLGTSG